MRYGIDVSFHRGFPDWSKARGNVDFAILAVTERYKGVDETFEHNYRGCMENGIAIGAYSYSYAESGDDSERFARLVVEALRGKTLDLPVFLDLEWEDQEGYSEELLTEIIERFRAVVVGAGFKFGIYCNKDWYANRIPASAKGYPLWLGWPATRGNDCPEEKKPDYPNLVCWQYSWTGTVPGFDESGNVDMDVWYGEESLRSSVTAEDALDVIRGWLGRSEADESHRAIIDIYNSHEPLAQGYRMSYSDSWCDATVSAVFISLGATDLIGGTECGVERHVELFRKAGIWYEDGTIRPEPGDIIVFNWGLDEQPNDGFADHIGLVEYVEGKRIHTIEGNSGGSVARRSYPIGHGNIRGFARPRYATASQEATGGPETAVKAETDDLPMLSIGNAGEAVLRLQRELNAFGCGLEEDGWFGPKTQTAVLHYQQAHGLEVDGVVGPETWGSLMQQKPQSIEEWAKSYIDDRWPEADQQTVAVVADAIRAYLEGNA